MAASYLIIAVMSVPVTLVTPVLFPALHPATGTALGQLPPVMRMWYLSALLLLLAISALYIAGVSVPRAFAVSALLLAAAVGGYLLWENAQPLYRVYNATIAGDLVRLYTDGGELVVSRSQITLNPLVVNGTAALTGHLVTKEGRVVTHWSVGANLIMTGAALMFISAAWRRDYE